MVLLHRPGRLALHTATVAFRVAFTGALDLGLAVLDPGRAPDVDAWLDGLVAALPHGQVEFVNVLAIGAHPDDIELGCGATFWRTVSTATESRCSS